MIPASVWPTGDEMIGWFKEMDGVPDIGVYNSHVDFPGSSASRPCEMCAVGVMVAHHVASYVFDRGHPEILAVHLSEEIGSSLSQARISIRCFEDGAWFAHYERLSEMDSADEYRRTGQFSDIVAWQAGRDAWTAVEQAVADGVLMSKTSD